MRLVLSTLIQSDKSQVNAELAHGDSGIVDEDVDRTELGEDILFELAHLRFVGNIGAENFGLRAQSAGLIGDGIELRNVARHQGNAHARLCQR